MKLINNKISTYIICVLLFFVFIQNKIIAKDVEFPLIQSFSYFPYSDNNVLQPGFFDIGIDIYHSNIFTFNNNDNIMNDFALTSFTFGFRYGLSNSITTEVFVRYMTVTGGFMDGFIEKFHSFFGLPDAYRLDYPRDVVSYFNNDIFAYENSTGTISPVIFSALVKLYSKNSFDIKTRIAFGVPLKSKPGLSSDKLFLTLGLVCSYQSDNLRVDLSNYVSWFKEPEWFSSVALKDRLFFSEIRISYKRFLTGFIIKTSPLIESESSRNAYQIQLGFKINDNIEFLFLEDFAPFDTSPDVSFNLRIKF